MFALAHFRTLIALIAIAFCSGCSIYTKFDVTPEEQARIGKLGFTSVLMRFTLEWDGKTDDVSAGPQVFGILPGVEFLNVDTGDRFGLEGQLSRTNGTPYFGHGGWLRILLKPGTYLVAPIVPVHGVDRASPTETNPYKFTVPTEAHAIYIGSFRVKCRGRLWAKLSYTYIPKNCTDGYALSDESRAAAWAYNASAGTLQAAVAHPFGRLQLAGEDPPSSKPLPLVSLTNVAKSEVPNWYRFDKETSNEQDGGSLKAMTPTGAEFVFLPPLLLITGLVKGAAAKEVETRWGPCVAKLNEALGAENFGTVFKERFRAHAGSPTRSEMPVSTQERDILEGTVRRVRLRKCKDPQSYCMELAVRTTLRQSSTERLSYDAIHVYSSKHATGADDWGPDRTHYFWEQPVTRQSPCRNISAYCGEGGRRMALNELRTALDAIALAVATDLGLVQPNADWGCSANDC